MGKSIRGVCFLSLGGGSGDLPRENFTILEVHKCNLNTILDHLSYVQSQRMMITTIYRLENLQMTDHGD